MQQRRFQGTRACGRPARASCARARRHYLEALEPRQLLTTFGPFLPSSWAQEGSIGDTGITWNQFAPIDPATQLRSLAGCVPVAIAQIASYWQFPQKITLAANEGYTVTFPTITQYPEQAAQGDMPTIETVNSTLESVDYAAAIDQAMLTFAVGIKGRTVFASTGTHTDPTTLTFGKLGFQSAVMATDWNAALPRVIDNLRAGMPVFLAIQSPTIAHAVVIDGYDDVTEKFHLRLGWGPGSDNDNGENNWFALPTFTAGGLTFNAVNAVIYDIMPVMPAPEATATQGAFKSKVRITWDTQPAALGYEIYRSTTNDPDTAKRVAKVTAATFSFDDPNVTTRKNYYYWVKALSSEFTPGSTLGDPTSGYAGTPHPVTPINLSPTPGESALPLTATLNASTFADPSAQTHKASQWIITRTNGTTVLNTTSKTQLTSFTIPAGKLSYSTTYTWKVRYQGANGSWSDYSLPTSFTTQEPPDLTPPANIQATWATAPFALSPDSISMTATTPTDPSGIEYYFQNLTVTGHDSGWQDSSTYNDINLDPNTLYSYQVLTRDKSPAQNAGTWSHVAAAFTQAAGETPGGTPFSGTLAPTSTQSLLTNATTIHLTLTLESAPTDLTLSSFTVAGTAGGIVTAFTNSDTTFTIAITGMTHSGQLFLAIPAGTLHDAEGDSNLAILSPSIFFTTVKPKSGNAKSFFDETWYLTQNPDAAKAIQTGTYTNAWAHFLAIGEKQGRSPSLFFNETYYVNANADVQKAILNKTYKNGFRHFVATGYNKKRPGIDLTPINFTL